MRKLVRKGEVSLERTIDHAPVEAKVVPLKEPSRLWYRRNDLEIPSDYLGSAEETYIKLKNSPLYDATDDIWLSHMDEKDVVDDRVISTHAQLLDVLALQVLGKQEEAHAKFERLLNDEEYNFKRSLWDWHPEKGTERKGCHMLVGDQLLGLVCQSFYTNRPFIIDNVRSMRGRGAFYKWDMKLWKYSYRKDGSDLYSSDEKKTTYNQMLGVLLLERAGLMEEASDQYHRLQSTKLFDEHLRQWNYSRHEGMTNASKHSSVFLLDVIVNSVLGHHQSAIQRHDFALRSGVYDEKKGLWCWNSDGWKEEPSRFRFASDQLLGVIAKKYLEKGGKDES